MIKKNLNTKINFLFWLMMFSFLIRFVVVYFLGDQYNEPKGYRLGVNNEWNVLLAHLIKYKSYSLLIFNEQLIPSVFMPPMYPFFLYSINFISNFSGDNLMYAIIFIQIILSTYCVYIFYQINQNFFSNKLSLINSIVFSIIPLNLYYCGQISSINLQVLFSLLFLKFLILIIKEKNQRNIIFFSIISGAMILTRGEFILIFLCILFFVFLKKKIKFTNLVKIMIIISIVVSPYMVRNYIHFNEIFIVKSLGYNLWKGNNELANVEGYTDFEKIEFKKLKNNIDNLEKNKHYEINRDNIFLEEAIGNLKNNFSKYFILFFKKFFSYYFIDINSSYPNYYNFFHIFPIILISILSAPGLLFFYKNNKLENECFGIYLFSNLIIFSIFFILPRYKLVILPIQIILAAYFINYIMKRYVSK
mgnify:CR=1 FL=1